MDMGGDRQRVVRDGGAVGPGRPGDGPRLAVLRDAPPDGRAVCLAGAPDQTPGRARPGLRLVQAAHLGWRAHPRGVLEPCCCGNYTCHSEQSEESTRGILHGACPEPATEMLRCAQHDRRRVQDDVVDQEEAGSGLSGGGAFSVFRKNMMALASSSLTPRFGILVFGFMICGYLIQRYTQGEFKRNPARSRGGPISPPLCPIL